MGANKLISLVYKFITSVIAYKLQPTYSIELERGKCMKYHCPEFGRSLVQHMVTVCIGAPMTSTRVGFSLLGRDRNPQPTIHTLTGSHHCTISYNQNYPHPILYPQPNQQHPLSPLNTILCHTSLYNCMITPPDLIAPGHPTPTWPESGQFFSTSHPTSTWPDTFKPKHQTTSTYPYQSLCVRSCRSWTYCGVMYS